MTSRPVAKKSIRPRRSPSRMANTSGDSGAARRQWIIVADHRQVHIYQKTSNGMERLPEECLHCALPVPGGEQDDILFFEDLAEWLQEATRARSFDRLAIIASPAALKFIEPLLDRKVRNRVCAALAKDVEKITEDEIEDHLADVVWF